MKDSLFHYRNFTVILCEISAVGLSAALIANFAFLNAVLGFLLGAIFFVASAIAQAIFMNRAFLSVENELASLK